MVRSLAVALLLIITSCSNSNSDTPSSEHAASPTEGAPSSPTDVGLVTLPNSGSHLMRPSIGVYGNIDISQGRCGQTSLDDALLLEQCGLLKDSRGQVYAVYIVGSLSNDPNHLVIEQWQPQGPQLFTLGWRGDFDGNSITLESSVLQDLAGEHLLIVQNQFDGTVVFDVISPGGGLTAHDSSIAIQAAGEDLYIWHSPDRRETFTYRRPAAPDQVGRWEQVQVSSISAPE